MKRLTPALLTLIMFGVVGLLVAAYVAKSLFAKEVKRPVVSTRTIPMPNSDIEPGTMITENNLGMGYIKVNELERDMLLSNRVIVGRVAKTRLTKAEPIRADSLYAPGELPPLQIAHGMRAVSLEVGDSVSMVDGLIKPGHFVDLLFTVRGANIGDDALQGGLTMKLFDGVKVLAINRSQVQSRVERNGNRVTLELTEEQANILTLAKDRGSINLTYNPNGKGKDELALTNSDRVTLYEILGLKKKDPEPEPFVTEIYRGAGRSANMFRADGRSLGGAGGGAGSYMGYTNGNYGGSSYMGYGSNRGGYEIPGNYNTNRGQQGAAGSGQQNAAPNYAPAYPNPSQGSPVVPAPMQPGFNQPGFNQPGLNGPADMLPPGPAGAPQYDLPAPPAPGGSLPTTQRPHVTRPTSVSKPTAARTESVTR